MSYDEFIIGKRHRLSWVDETSFGVGGTMSGGDVIGLNATIEPDFNQRWQEILSAGADTRAVENRVLGPKDLPFTLNFTMVDWKFLKYLGYSVADAGSNPYTHTFSLSNTVQTFKLEWAMQKSDTDVVITLTGCFAMSATVQFQKAAGEGQEGFVNVSMQCYAKSYSLGSSVTSLSAITRSPFQWRHTHLELDNSEVVELNSGNLVIETGIDPNDSRYCNDTLDRDVGAPILKIQRLKGAFNINYKDNTFLSQYDTGDEISNCGISFIQNATNNKVVMNFSGFRWESGAFPSVDLENVSSAELQYSGEGFSSLIATDTISTY